MLLPLSMVKRPKPKMRFFLATALAVVGFFALLTIFGEEGLIRLKNLYSLRDRIRQENHQLFNANQKLIEQIHLLNEPLYAERLIREKLGYVKPREYILILGENSGNESRPSLGSIPRTEKN